MSERRRCSHFFLFPFFFFLLVFLRPPGITGLMEGFLVGDGFGAAESFSEELDLLDSELLDLLSKFQSMPMLKKLIYQILVESKFCAEKELLAQSTSASWSRLRKKKLLRNVMFTLILFQL